MEMKISLFDGSSPNDPMASRILQLLSTRQAEHFVLSKMAMAPCAGEFRCWTRTPGICKNNDDNLLLARAMVQSDLLVLLTPLTFGGYSSHLKQGLDHLIQDFSPFFCKVQGETHHKRRYENYPNLCVFGWAEKEDPQAEQIFRHLVGRNAINFNARRACCYLFYPTQSDEEIGNSIDRALGGSRAEPLPNHLERRKSFDASTGAETPAKTLLLVGSPRKSQSTSLCLGTYLCSRLNQEAIRTKTVQLYGRPKGEEAERLLFSTIAEVDLVVLAFPLYIDTLPAPVIDFLERLSSHRKTHPDTKAPHLVALVNCGFPEASQMDNVLALLSQFCKEAGFVWGGGMALGGRHGLGDKPLAKWGSSTLAIRAALDLASEALSHGQAIPQQAVELLAKPQYPSALFRFGAQFFWKKEGANHGIRKAFHARPYVEN